MRLGLIIFLNIVTIVGVAFAFMFVHMLVGRTPWQAAALLEERLQSKSSFENVQGVGKALIDDGYEGCVRFSCDDPKVVIREAMSIVKLDDTALNKACEQFKKEFPAETATLSDHQNLEGCTADKTRDMPVLLYHRKNKTYFFHEFHASAF